LLVHIGDPSSNQATTLESQVIHMIQELFGQTLTLQLPFMQVSESMGNHDSKIVDAASVD